MRKQPGLGTSRHERAGPGLRSTGNRCVGSCPLLFGISTDVAMQVVAIGFVIGVVQDSAETALNSPTDVLLTAAGRPHDHPLP